MTGCVFLQTADVLIDETTKVQVARDITKELTAQSNYRSVYVELAAQNQV